MLSDGKTNAPDCQEEELVNRKLCYHNKTATEGIKNVLNKNPEITANSFEDIRPSTAAVTHRFELTSNNLIYLKARRMSPMLNEIARKEVDRMLAAGIITSIEWFWTSPVIIATKEDRSLRFCVDSKKLNSLMNADRWPIPRVDEILDDMKGSSIFTNIDLFQVYWQINMDEACKERAAFICRYGTFQFEFMSLSLMNLQATFQRIMERILLRVSNAKCYVEDVVILSGNEEEQLKQLENFFAITKENGLLLNIKKRSFMQSSLELLTHIVDKYEVRVDEEKILKIKEESPPTTRMHRALSLD